MKPIISTAIAFILATSILLSAYILSKQRYYDRITPAAEILLLKTELNLERHKNECFEQVTKMHMEELGG